MRLLIIRRGLNKQDDNIEWGRRLEVKRNATEHGPLRVQHQGKVGRGPATIHTSGGVWNDPKLQFPFSCSIHPALATRFLSKRASRPHQVQLEPIPPRLRTLPIGRSVASSYYLIAIIKFKRAAQRFMPERPSIYRHIQPAPSFLPLGNDATLTPRREEYGPNYNHRRTIPNMRCMRHWIPALNSPWGGCSSPPSSLIIGTASLLDELISE